MLQVDAAYDSVASLAANGLLHVDAAHATPATSSSCRGGMGEAQEIRRGTPSSIHRGEGAERRAG